MEVIYPGKHSAVKACVDEIVKLSGRSEIYVRTNKEHIEERGPNYTLLTVIFSTTKNPTVSHTVKYWNNPNFMPCN